MANSVWLPSFIAAIALFQLVAIPALLWKRNDFADVLWAPAFPMVALAGAHWGLNGGIASLSPRASLVIFLVSLWALRLFLHLGFRNLRKKEEDIRYRNWREEWGKTQVWRSYLQVWLLQPLILYLFALPMLVVIQAPEAPLSGFALVGAGVWLVGFLFEAIGDEQLRRHKANPQNKGKLITTGLWAWSRHPNYFGEVVIWWGVWLMAADLPYGLYSIIAPAAVTYLLWAVSGVAMTEALMKKREGFSEYASRTSVFFPWPPRRS